MSWDSSASGAANRSQEAMGEYQISLRLQPQQPDSHYERGRIHHFNGQPEQAAHAYRAAVETDAAHFDAHRQLGATLLELGDLASAEQILRRAVELRSTSAEVHRDLGIVLLRQGKVDSAVAELRQAETLLPGDPATLYNFGRALLQRAQRLNRASEYSILEKSYNEAGTKLLHASGDRAEPHQADRQGNTRKSFHIVPNGRRTVSGAVPPGLC